MDDINQLEPRRFETSVGILTIITIKTWNMTTITSSKADMLHDIARKHVRRTKLEKILMQFHMMICR